MDYKQILEVCEKAPKGPWKQGDKTSETKQFYGNSHVIAYDKGQAPYVLLTANVNMYHYANATNFIALARTALPELVKRCMELEAENKILHEGILKNSNVIVNTPPLPENVAIRILQNQIETLQKDFADKRQYVSDLYNRARNAERRNERLEQVAEAAEYLKNGIIAQEITSGSKDFGVDERLGRLIGALDELKDDE